MLVRRAKLGLWVDGAWFCSEGCVEATITDRLHEATRRTVRGPTPRARLGALLVRQGAITAAQLAQALESQATSGLRLGAELQRLGYADRETVLRALSAQSGVSYLAAIHPASVRHAPGELTADEVRALGVVPFQAAEGGTMLVACPAPLPRTALAALQALVGCRVEPYLVADEDFETLRRAYVAAAAPRAAQASTALDIRDGASRIAAAASAARSVTVTEAHLDPFTLVRIAANGRISTLLVPPSLDTLEEEPGCPVATTLH